MSFRYYQPPKAPLKHENEETSESESDSCSRRGSRNERSANKAAISKRAGACVHCKSLKVKCNFAAGQETCQRCVMNKLECVVFGRKKRRAVATHEELILRSHRQDQEISHLLSQFDQLTVERQRQVWLSKAHKGPMSEGSSQSSSRSSERGKDAFAWSSAYSDPQQPTSIVGYPSVCPSSSSPDTRKANVIDWLQFFPDSSVNERSPLPEIVVTGFVSPDDVLNLFRLFFDHINPNFSILDPGLHTPTRLLWHHHFLFTLVCTCASRIDEHYFDIYPALIEVARSTAGNALVHGKKDVSDCQAFLLCAVYQAPRKKWEDQRGWLYMGIAFTLAQELKLGNVEPEPGISEREHLNRIRTWLNCYCVDWSHATQFGKPAMISVDDYAARSCRNWYISSQYSMAIDIHLVAYVEMLRTMGHFKREIAKPGLDINEILQQTFKYCDRLSTLSSDWSRRFDEHPEASTAWMFHYRSDLNRMINAYNRLVVLSYGFQKAVAEKGVHRKETIVRLCIETAKEVIDGMTKKLYYTGMLKYSMDAHLLFVTFAAGFLLNLLNPKFSVLLSPGDEPDIIRSVVDLVKVLQSDQVKLSERHAPALYARYMKKQLKNIPGALSLLDQSVATQYDSQFSYGVRLAVDNKHLATIDSTVNNSSHPLMSGSTTPQSEAPYYGLSGLEMDFSLPYFVQMVSDQSKPSPPPQDSAEMWWQASFPVDNSNSSVCQWPMAQYGN